MACDVHVAGALQRQLSHVFVGVEAVVAAVDVDVVHVQVQQAARFLHHLAHEGGVIHLGAFGRRVVAGILDADLLTHVVLHLGNALGHMTHRLVGGRQRQQVIELPFVPAPRQVLGVEGDSIGPHEGLHFGQKLHVQTVTAAQVQRQPMTGQRPVLADCRQIPRKASAQPAPVLGRHLEEGHHVHRACFQHGQRVGQQAPSQAQPGTMQQPNIPGISRHDSFSPFHASPFTPCDPACGLHRRQPGPGLNDSEHARTTPGVTEPSYRARRSAKVTAPR